MTYARRNSGYRSESLRRLNKEEFQQHERDQAALEDALGVYPRLRANAITALILREDGWAELKPYL